MKKRVGKERKKRLLVISVIVVIILIIGLVLLLKINREKIQLSPNYCNSNNDCSVGYLCNIQTHNCEDQIKLSLATLKDVYKKGEIVQLTDPPEEIEEVKENVGINKDVIEDSLNPPQLAPDIESEYNLEKAKSFNPTKNELEKLITSSQNLYEIQLDIPSYLDQKLSNPNKFFSGRKVKITRKDETNLPIIPEILILSKRDNFTKSFISSFSISTDKKKQDSFSFTIPSTMESGYYTLEFDIKNEKIVLPIQLLGLTQEEKSQIKSKSIFMKEIDSQVLFVKRLDCDFCYWESVSTINPTDENFGYLVGGWDYLITTSDGWQTNKRESIDWSTFPRIRKYRGDPKLEFSTSNQLLIASLLENPSEPITGGIYTENTPKSIHPRFTQTYVQSIPPSLSSEQLIFDYEKIAVDKDPSSKFFGTIYMSVNGMMLEGKLEYGSTIGPGLVTIKPNGEVTEKIVNNPKVGLYITPASLLAGKNGILYAGGGCPCPAGFKIYRSLDGGETFSKSELPGSLLQDFCSGSRVSTNSNRAWGIYYGPELAQDKRNGGLYAVWVKNKECRYDNPVFEYESYSYDNDVFISYSDNEGVTWSSPIRVNDDFSGGDQGFPDIAVDENGVVYIVFLDHRNNQDLSQFDVYLAFSFDNGQTFSKNIKLNDVSVANFYGGRDPGDYLDMLSVGSERVYVTYPCMNSNVESMLPGRPNDACVSVLNKFRPQSKITNDMPTSLSGIVTFKIEVYENGRWSKYYDERTRSSRVTIPAKGLVKLDKLFNNYKISIDEVGKYRIVGTFTDSTGRIKRSTSWEFRVVGLITSKILGK